jgi:hypothetical protein
MCLKIKCLFILMLALASLISCTPNPITNMISKHVKLDIPQDNDYFTPQDLSVSFWREF